MRPCEYEFPRVQHFAGDEHERKLSSPRRPRKRPSFRPCPIGPLGYRALSQKRWHCACLRRKTKYHHAEGRPATYFPVVKSNECGRSMPFSGCVWAEKLYVPAANQNQQAKVTYRMQVLYKYICECSNPQKRNFIAAQRNAF